MAARCDNLCESKILMISEVDVCTGDASPPPPPSPPAPPMASLVCFDKIHHIGTTGRVVSAGYGRPGYFQSASSNGDHHNGQHPPHKAIDGSGSTDWHSLYNSLNQDPFEYWMSLGLPSGTQVSHVYVTPTSRSAHSQPERLLPLEIWVSDVEGGRDASVATLCGRFLSPAPVYTADCCDTPGTYVTFVKRSPAPHSNHPTRCVSTALAHLTPLHLAGQLLVVCVERSVLELWRVRFVYDRRG